jgi:type IV pilus assembly protein PilY1
MTPKRLLQVLATMALPAFVHLAAFAEDTDLFASPNTAAAANIMVVFDNAASFDASSSQACSIDSLGTVKVDGTGTSPTALSGSAGGVEQCALYSALAALPANTTPVFNVGFMMFNATGLQKFDPTVSSPSNPFSACPSSGLGGCNVVSIVGYTPTVKANLLNWVKNWQKSGNSGYNIKTNSLASGAAMQETWAVFQGKRGISGTTYTAPTIGCGKDYVIYVGDAYRNNTTPSDQTGSKGPKQYLVSGSDTATGMYANPKPTTAQLTSFTDTVSAKYGLGASQIVCTKGGSSSYTFPGDSETDGSWGLNWSAYMWGQPGIKTTAIGFLGATCLPSYSAWLQRLAEVGGGDFYATNDYATLVKAFEASFGNIISVNSVFASVSLPVSVNTQGSYLNQIFVGMFRPDAGFLPRWLGNLKQYKLGFTANGNLETDDADGAAAINNNTGFIKACARSFWTPNTTTNQQYWSLSPSGECVEVSGSAASDYPDGNVVEKGAQAFGLRQMAPSARVVKTCGSTLATCTGWSDYKSTSAPAASLFGSGLTSTDAATLVDWSRGLNTQDELVKGTTVMRPSVHGDVMHSRPVALNYGTDTVPQVIVYYGANDGMLHAVNGNQTDSFTANGNTYAAGAELWTFMPPEFYGQIKRLYDNTTPVYYRGGPDPSALPKPYGMDGPVTAFKGTLNGAAKTYLYATMRRGGRALYAFDVTTPASPSFLWKVGCSGTDLTSTDCGSTTASKDYNYTNIGQTWSSAKVILANGYNSGTVPLLLMGGGYDTCEDADTGTGGANNSCTGSPKGGRVYVIDGTDGHIVAQFPTVAPFTGGAPRSVIGDATVVNANGIAKYAYIADLGGVVYRLDFTAGTVSGWTMTPIAKVGCDSLTACSANRKFMFQPSVVSTDGTTFDILLGSGDREKPTRQYGASNGVQNYFFMLQDQPGSASFLQDQCGSGNNFLCLNSLQPVTAGTTPSSAALAAKKGWYLALAATEQVVTSAITQFGITTFSTHQPQVATNTCSNKLGTSLVYNLSYANAGPVNGSSSISAEISGDGLPPSPVAGSVLINGSPVSFCIGCSPDSPLQGRKAQQSSSVARAKNRLYWYVEKK